MYSEQPGVFAQPYGRGYPSAQPPMGAPGMGYQQPFPTQMPPMQQMPMPQTHYPEPMNLQQQRQKYYQYEYPTQPRAGVVKTTIFGLLFYIIIAIASGLGALITILAAGPSSIGFGIIVGAMPILMGPVFALVIGVIQGKITDSESSAMIAGGVGNVVGFFILLLIIAGFLAAAFSIKFPTESSDSGGDVGQTVVDILIQYVGLLLPSGIIGALSAFFSEKYIFTD